jgi:hypothetical protein
MANADQIFTDEQLQQQGQQIDKSILQRAIDGIQQGWEDLRIGDGHAAGMARLGGHEITQALVALPDSNVRPMDEPGVFGNPTPQIVTSEMGFDQMFDNYANRGTVHGQEQDRGMER